jgi:hypothetical protein
MANDCSLNIPLKEPKKNIKSHKQEPQRIWRRKKDQFNTEYLSISLQAKHKKSGWYVDIGCSKHMAGDKNNFMTLKKEQDGLVSFGNDNSTRIIGRGTINIGSTYAKGENVQLVKDMKQNVLSFNQMCDQGQIFLFD